MMTRKISRLLSTAMLAALAACGGGGGGSEPTTSVPPQPVAYAAGSEELAVLTLLNGERDRCGFGTLAQNAQLDAAARGHANYQLIHSLIAHLQDALGFPIGFTGTLPSDRVLAAGYLGAGPVADEIAGFLGTDQKAGLGAAALRNLLNAPYHLQGLMSGFRDVGIAVRSSLDTGVGRPAVLLQINAAYQRVVGPQLFAGTEVRTYPCEGTSGVNFKLSNEQPNPVPGRDLSINPLGSSIYIAVRAGNIIQITSVSMVSLPTGQLVTLRLPITAANDPYRSCAEGCFKSHQAYVAADAPLQPNSPYRVTVNGSNNGTSFSRTFTFTTGAGG